jgi:hypothetical protein
MAVYQGARRRQGFTLPLILRPGASSQPAAGSQRSQRAAGARAGAGARAAAHGRRLDRGRVGLAVPSTQRVGLILGSIVVVFSGAFLWLTQSVRVAATNYDIVRLTAEHDRLQALSVDLQDDLDRLSGAPSVRQAALANGLGQLGAPVVIPAR